MTIKQRRGSFLSILHFGEKRALSQLQQRVCLGENSFRGDALIEDIQLLLGRSQTATLLSRHSFPLTERKSREMQVQA